jgi:hypothetical protein
MSKYSTQKVVLILWKRLIRRVLFYPCRTTTTNPTLYVCSLFDVH